MNNTILLKKEHPETGTVITGYGITHFIKKWNLHTINRKVKFFLPEDTPDIATVEEIIRGKEEISDVDEMSVGAFKELSATEQRELLKSHGVDLPGSNYTREKHNSTTYNKIWNKHKT